MYKIIIKNNEILINLYISMNFLPFSLEIVVDSNLFISLFKDPLSYFYILYKNSPFKLVSFLQFFMNDIQIIVINKI